MLNKSLFLNQSISLFQKIGSTYFQIQPSSFNTAYRKQFQEIQNEKSLYSKQQIRYFSQSKAQNGQNHKKQAKPQIFGKINDSQFKENRFDNFSTAKQQETSSDTINSNSQQTHNSKPTWNKSYPKINVGQESEQTETQSYQSEDERKQKQTLDNANALLKKSEEENYQKHDTLVHFFMILKYCIMNKLQVMEYLRSKPVMEMFEKYTTHLASNMTSERIEQVAFGISQIKRRDVQMVLSKVLVDIITLNSERIKDDEDLLRMVTRIIDVHKIRLTDESIHTLDKLMFTYLENTVAQKNQLSNPQSFLQSFAIIIKQLYENGQSMELKKTLTWTLNHFNQLLDSNQTDEEEFEKILQKLTFFVNEVGATVGVNQELMNMQFDIISKIIKYINRQDITKVESKMLYFTLLMCGKNAVYHEEFITKAVQETFKRYQSGKLSKMDFADFLDTMKNLNMVDKTVLQNLEIINGGFVKRYDNKLTIKDLTRIYDSFLQEIDHIPPKTCKYFLDQLTKSNIENLNPIQIRMTKGTLHYLIQINYFSNDANLENKVQQILDLLNKQYEIVKIDSKQSSQLIPPPKTQLIESKLTASLERQSSRLGKIERQKVINDKYIVDFYLPDYQTTKVVELLGPVHYIKHLKEDFSEITITKELNGKCKQKIKYLHAFNLKSALIDYRDIQNLNLNETTNLLIDLI